MNWKNRIGLAILLGAVVFVIASNCHADTLPQMLPCHGPTYTYRAPVENGDPMFGLICTIAAILFMWSVYDIVVEV